jgi:hypothetical protein
VQQTVTAVTISPSQLTVGVGGTVQPLGAARDAGGAAVAGAPLAWSSGNGTIASVNPNSGLVTGVALGATLITATSGALSASVPVEVITPPLAIAKDTIISGNVNVNGFSVAAGFTVTVNGPLTLRSTRLISIAGTLTGVCQSFDIQSDTAVVITGTVANSCAPAAGGAPLTIAANGELIVQNALIRSSGPIKLSNDPVMLASPLRARPAPVGTFAAQVLGLPGIPMARFGGATVRYGGDVITAPAPNGSDGVNGGAGGDGNALEILIDGNIEFVGNTLIWGEDGGAGGVGTNSGTGNVTVAGGRGGAGGDVRLLVGGSLSFSGANNIIRAGAGGRGGNAAATTLTTTVGTKAATAFATGGNGGSAGIVEVSAGGGVFVNAIGALAFEIGLPGDGGNALATSAHGVHASSARNAQGGGDAIARGGNGGSTPDVQLSTGLITFGSAITRAVPPATELNGGKGGEGKTVAGNGGNGNKQFKHGANGGGMNATGGNGGAALLRGANGEGLGFGGNAGLAWLTGGNAGNGWNDCVPGGYEAGGFGAFGGGSSGTAGTAGTGRLGPGFTAMVRFDDASNGGNAGGGNPPGNPGTGGVKVVNGTETSFGENFTNGDPGVACPLVGNTPPQADVWMAIDGGWSSNSQGQIVPGMYTRLLTPSPGAAGIPGSNMFFSTQTATFGTYYHNLSGPARIGFLAGGGWDINLLGIDAGGPEIDVGSFVLCFLNENPPVSVANPIIVRQIDNPGTTLFEQSITTGVPPDGRAGCLSIGRFKETSGMFREATHVKILRPTGSVEMDHVGITAKAMEEVPQVSAIHLAARTLGSRH